MSEARAQAGGRAGRRGGVHRLRRRCSPPSGWMRCSCARRPRPTRRRRPMPWRGGSRSTSRSRWPARWPTARRSSRPGEAERAVCAVGYQWRSLDVWPRCCGAGRTPPGMLVSRSFGGTESGRGDLDNAPGSTGSRSRGAAAASCSSWAATTSTCSSRSPGRSSRCRRRRAAGRLALVGREDAGGLDDAVTVLMRFAGGGSARCCVGWTDAQDPAVYSLDVQAPGVALELELDPVLRAARPRRRPRR